MLPCPVARNVQQYSVRCWERVLSVCGHLREARLLEANECVLPFLSSLHACVCLPS
jgi:hypothetical protein